MKHLSLHDFTIKSGAELGTCGNKGSFRAIYRQKEIPVLLHRFRPAECLFKNNPIIQENEPPDFKAPFISRFTGLFEAANSVYLVEPLPVSVLLIDVWRCLLLKSPEDASGFVEILIKQLLAVLLPLVKEGKKHGAVHVDNIILTQNSSYGILSAHLNGSNGRIWLRTHSEIYPNNDYAALGQVIQNLLYIEDSMAKAQNHRILPSTACNSISQLVHELKNIKYCAKNI